MELILKLVNALMTRTRNDIDALETLGGRSGSAARRCRIQANERRRFYADLELIRIVIQRELSGQRKGH